MILFRYLSRQVLITMLAVTLILLLVFMSGRFIKYLAQAASGGLAPDVLFQIMFYRLPGFLELILPLGFFLGILLAYGRMYLESEMTVMHACGYGRGDLLRSTLLMSVLVTACVGSLSLYFSPAGMQKVETIFADQAKVTEFEMLVPGRFQKFSRGGRVTYAQSLSDDKRTMYDVFISEAQDREGELTLLYASEGVQEVDAQGNRYLLLKRGTRYHGEPGSLKFEAIDFDTYGVLIEIPDAEQRSVKEEAVPTMTLWGSDDLEDRALLQWRVSLPLLVPIVTILAVALCRVNPRQGRFFHLLPSMLVYVAYLGALIVARKNVGKGELDPVLGVWLVHGVFLMLALGLYYREELMKRMFSAKVRQVADA